VSAFTVRDSSAGKVTSSSPRTWMSVRRAGSGFFLFLIDGLHHRHLRGQATSGVTHANGEARGSRDVGPECDGWSAIPCTRDCKLDAAWVRRRDGADVAATRLYPGGDGEQRWSCRAVPEGGPKLEGGGRDKRDGGTDGRREVLLAVSVCAGVCSSTEPSAYSMSQIWDLQAGQPNCMQCSGSRQCTEKCA
jgi:hypothetical protein